MINRKAEEFSFQISGKVLREHKIRELVDSED